MKTLRWLRPFLDLGLTCMNVVFSRTVILSWCILVDFVIMDSVLCMYYWTVSFFISSVFVSQSIYMCVDPMTIVLFGVFSVCVVVTSLYDFFPLGWRLYAIINNVFVWETCWNDVWLCWRDLEYFFSSFCERSNRLSSDRCRFRRNGNAGASGPLFRLVSTCSQFFWAVIFLSW